MQNLSQSLLISLLPDLFPPLLEKKGRKATQAAGGSEPGQGQLSGPHLSLGAQREKAVSLAQHGWEAGKLGLSLSVLCIRKQKSCLPGHCCG